MAGCHGGDLHALLDAGTLGDHGPGHLRGSGGTQRYAGLVGVSRGGSGLLLRRLHWAENAPPPELASVGQDAGKVFALRRPP